MVGLLFIGYNFRMDSSLQSAGKAQPLGSKSDADMAEDVPGSGEFYRYLCPVDHKSNFVTMRGIRCKDTNQPALLIVHDVGEKSEMYWDCIKYICEKGSSSYAYDQRGHGADAEISGHLDRFQDLVNDLLQVTSWVRHLHGGIPPVIVGQGYGAIVATELAAKHPQFITGVVLTAPTLELAWKPGAMKRYLIRMMAELAPRVRVPKGLHPRFSNPLHRDVGKTMATRLIQSLIGPKQQRLTFAFAQELFEAMDNFEKLFHSLRKPALILKPGDDEVARYEAMDNISSSHPGDGLVISRTVANVHHNGFTEGKLPMESILEEVLTWKKAIYAKSKSEIHPSS